MHRRIVECQHVVLRDLTLRCRRMSDNDVHVLGHHLRASRPCDHHSEQKKRKQAYRASAHGHSILALGYKKSNKSPILKLLLSRLDELVARVSKTERSVSSR